MNKEEEEENEFKRMIENNREKNNLYESNVRSRKIVKNKAKIMNVSKVENATSLSH